MNRSILACQLDTEERVRLFDVPIFRAETSVPLDVVAVMWAMDGFDVGSSFNAWRACRCSSSATAAGSCV